MNKKLLYFLFFLPFFIQAQVTTSPAVPTANDEITVTLITTGTGLDGYTGDIYAHTGVTVDGEQWQNVFGDWGDNSTSPKLTKISSTTYQLVIAPDVFTYYGVSAGKTISELDFVFRSSDSSKQTSPDIFIELFEDGLNVVLTNPSKNNEVYTLNQSITLSAESSLSADLELFVDNVSQKTVFGSTTISSAYTFTTTGSHVVKVDAESGSDTATDEKTVYVKTSTQNLPLPSGVKNGFNNNGDGTVTFVLTVPGKTNVFLLGEFNNFDLNENYQMNKDGDQFWVTISGLNPNVEYAYQYYVDYKLTVADPYGTKILDPNSDQYIPSETYPNLKPYPAGTTGIVSTFQMNEPVFNWTVNNFIPPDQNNLIVYELLIRDFSVVNTNDIGDLKRAMVHLDYLEDLGVNAIELMPMSEFENNDSWGYNPSFHGAMDKAYGTKNDLKTFIDECHKRGIAIILDVVYNQAFGQSPLAELYWDSVNNRPASDNPWLNPIPKHDFNVGNDFNHESAYTKDYVKQTLQYWLEEFRVDGFRFDLSKGFTQKNTLGNVSAWGQYDASRIAIIKDYGDFVWSINPDTYNILEHFAVNTEEEEFSDYGFMLWGNLNHNYNENTMGWGNGSKEDISWISYQKRGWNDPHVVGYMESHDEQRLMYKNLNSGNSSNASYDVKDLTIALSREETAANFLFTIPGPKMIWMFGELGYDYDINLNGRTGRKPVRWDYFDDPDRRKIYDVWATLIAFKKELPAFNTTNFTLDVNTLVKSVVLRHSSMDVVVLGNFDVTTKPIDPTFTKTGIWYEYYTGTELNVTNTNAPISLQAGEYRLYTTKQLQDPLPVEEIDEIQSGLLIYPNPARGFFKTNKSVKKVEIYDVLGRKIRSFSGSLNTGKEYDISTLKPSIYIVKISTEYGSTSQRLILE